MQSSGRMVNSQCSLGSIRPVQSGKLIFRRRLGPQADRCSLALVSYRTGLPHIARLGGAGKGIKKDIWKVGRKEMHPHFLPNTLDGRSSPLASPETD